MDSILFERLLLVLFLGLRLKCPFNTGEGKCKQAILSDVILKLEAYGVLIQSVKTK